MLAKHIICVIPAYNEKGNLEELIKRLETALTPLCKVFTIMFVIQGDDGSRELLDKITIKHSNITYLYYREPLGIGKAFQKGFEQVTNSYTHVLTLDADLNHNPANIIHLFNKMDTSKADLVVGSRYMPGGKFLDKRAWKRFASRFVNKVVQIILRIHIRDVTSGYRLMKVQLVRRVTPYLRESRYPYYMEFLVVAKRLGFIISEVPITYTPRRWGVSKMKILDTLAGYLVFFWRMLIAGRLNKNDK